MGGKGSSKMRVTDYFMSVHYGVCSGPVDLIRRILVKEKVAWSGSETAQTGIVINNRGLFGGSKKEGGVGGTAYYLPGFSDQVLPEALAQRLGLAANDCPAYRGLTTLWFVGNPGFYWGSNTPYLPGVWAEVQRRPRGLAQALAMLGDEANPAHIIYEVMTNADWGMGAPPSAMDIPSFEAAAQTLVDEGFGLSLIWTQQTEVERFVSNVIDHIQAALYVDPQTGLFTLKLIRDDYDPDALEIITPDDATMTSFQRKFWGETVNEVVVSWTNPENEQTETVTLQDLANIAMQGGVVSSTSDYEGVRNADLAMQLTARDLRSGAAPLAALEMQVDRKFSHLRPGGVVKVTWPEYGINELICRIGPCDYGKPGSSAIKLSLTEDIFADTYTAFTTPPSTRWEDTSEDPRPLDYHQVLTATWYQLVNTLDQATIVAAEYPEVTSIILGAQDGKDTSQFEVFTDLPTPAGTPEQQSVGTFDIVSRATLDAGLTFEATSVGVAFSGTTQGLGPTYSGFVLIGSGNDGDTELALITDIIGGTITLRRGILDTIPRDWPAGTPIWFMGGDERVMDMTIWSMGQSVAYKPCPWTSRGMLPINDSVEIMATLTDRPWLPLRPANVKIDGIASGEVDAIDAPSVEVTWANRNRLTEDSVVLAWDAATTAPEDGQTTSITVMDLDRNVLTTVSGLTGTSYSLPASAFSGKPTGIVRVTSEHDGLESLQGHEIIVHIAATAWGEGWGSNWSGG